jgi:hypothetical protein
MRITRLIAGIVSGALLGLIPVSLAPAANAGTSTPTVEINPRHTWITYGGTSYFYGRVSEPGGASISEGTAQVQISTNAGASWTNFGSPEDSSGYIVFDDAKLPQTALYRIYYSGSATYASAVSNPVKVGVRRKITGSIKSRTFAVKGKVTPKFAKKNLVIKFSKNRDKGYKTWKKIKTNKLGAYSVRLPKKRGYYYWRIIAPGDKAYMENWAGFTTSVY